MIYETLEQLILIRHAEAEKTERRVHGGPGTGLTQRGRLDSIDLARHLAERSLVSTASIVFTGPRPQALETAAILGRELHVTVKALSTLRNINMGIFDGLTDSEARTRDPEAMERLEAWRAGALPVAEIRIPGAEHLTQFVARVHSAVIEMARETPFPIVIVTRSLGIALHNLLGSTFNWDFDKYARVRLDPGSVTVYRRAPNAHMVPVEVNQTNYLTGERQFADD